MLRKKNNFKKRKWRHLSAKSRKRKRNSHVVKGWQTTFADNTGRGLTHYPHVFYNFSIYQFFAQGRLFIVTVCFIISIINYNLLEVQNFQDVSTSLQNFHDVLAPHQIQYDMLEIQVNFRPVFNFPWLFCKLLLNFQFCFYTVTSSSLVRLYFTFYSIP